MAAIRAVEGHLIERVNGRFGPEAAIMLIAVKVRFVRIPAVDPDRAYGNFWHFRNEPLRVCRQLYSIVGFVTKICVGCEHGVEDSEELASGGGYGCFDGLSGALQATAKGPEGMAPSGSV